MAKTPLRDIARYKDSEKNNQTEGSATTIDPSKLDYDYWYGEELRIARENAARNYDITKQAAESQYASQLELADQARQKSIIDANSAYQQNRSTYGTRGEALGRSGLSMSGYSDYADAAAYAASRQEVNNAFNTYAANGMTAKQNYDQTMLNAKATYQNAMDSADISYAEGMANEAKQREQEAIAYSNSFIESFNEDPDAYTVEQIESLYKSGRLTRDVADGAIGVLNQRAEARNAYIKNYDDAIAGIDDYNINDTLAYLENTLLSDYENGNVDEKMYQTIYGKLALAHAQKATVEDLEKTKEYINGILGEGKITGADAIKAINAATESVAQQFDMITNGIEKSKISDASSAKNSITISGKTYAVDLYKTTTGLNKTLNAVAGSKEKNTVAKYRDKYYIYDGERWYQMNPQGWDGRNALEKLMNSSK